MRRPVHVIATVKTESKGPYPCSTVVVSYRSHQATFYFRGSGHQRQAAGFAETCTKPHPSGMDAIRTLASAARSHFSDGGFGSLGLCGALAEADR